MRGARRIPVLPTLFCAALALAPAPSRAETAHVPRSQLGTGFVEIPGFGTAAVRLNLANPAAAPCRAEITLQDWQGAVLAEVRRPVSGQEPLDVEYANEGIDPIVARAAAVLECGPQSRTAPPAPRLVLQFGPSASGEAGPRSSRSGGGAVSTEQTF